MKSLIDNARTFATRVAGQSDEFRRLAAGQAPEALFITCSDSRVIPSLITGARPGELFELRTAGNVVPRYDEARPSAETATVEYALRVLGVRHIVVCGHSHCGAVGALVRGDDLSALPAVRGWLTHSVPEPPDTKDLAQAVRRHAVAQLDTLRGYPAVRELLANGELTLHAWYYEVDTGVVSAHHPEPEGEFRPL
ncbi:carbonic anhydrase [Streptomyces sp. CB03234]|uniref:carbonic anhydrase n=1 Tax=Streptomyces sp. (strain CB03234) TaxID=1703937 RepID=UPI00093FCAC5|nr:carbonic anhydrase [Streptomyces sp. CB03234]OKJ95035.1 carbonic anhydrase [Streptomyces sp. CB03234]